MEMNCHIYARFPPKAKLSKHHRYLEDVNTRSYSRDIGRSSVIGGEIFFQFGDTFCKDGEGEFCGLVANTIAHVAHPDKPHRTCYQHIHSDGKVNMFLPLTSDEKEWEREHGHEAGGSRIVIWSFGGIVEDRDGSGTGWCWYQKGIERKEGEPTFCGAGIARVVLNREDNTVSATRHTQMLFGEDSISWGTFSALRHGDYYYLYGCKKDRLYLARCPLADPQSAMTYTFFDGSTFVSDVTHAKHIWEKLQQGAIVPTRMFHPSHNVNFMFVGCNSWGDSMVQIATAPAPEGPWSDFSSVGPLLGIDYREGYRYCVYPHPWMCRPGSLGLTWSEHWPGAVILGKLDFEMEMMNKNERPARSNIDEEGERRDRCCGVL